ncbi:cell wall elongation regulator TseB-like domain-containing protein [Litchfieldia alkalitelluris]|uniref:cell wall elongation regulator TseB-like domain-containing protein n=1 Tax=Litchfieldia alkalitelluris TaxID=304268 RepID=UPI0009962925|nr:DUF5590 domain-containing protein [Litchfieldia alkalitelluris]
MKKWIIFVSIFIFLLVGWGFISIYQATVNVKFSEQEKAILKVQEDGILESIVEATTYYGTEEYQIVTGIDSNGDEVIVWVPTNEKKDMIKRNASEGVTKEEALDILLSNPELHPKEVWSIKLGMEWDAKTSKDRPIWEIIYLDENDRITYYRSFFSTGDYWKIIKP